MRQDSNLREAKPLTAPDNPNSLALKASIERGYFNSRFGPLSHSSQPIVVSHEVEKLVEWAGFEPATPGPKPGALTDNPQRSASQATECQGEEISYSPQTTDPYIKRVERDPD